ncbi:MAG: helix-turn-helix domain-containing protein [Eubacterium sp.]|nr:helix-turn-helix domain-containing protein [Eubacterium sp.]
MNNDNVFKISLKAARVNANLSQEQLAKILGVSKTTVNKWENAKTSISASQFQKLSALAGVPQDYIFCPVVN